MVGGGGGGGGGGVRGRGGGRGAEEVVEDEQAALHRRRPRRVRRHHQHRAARQHPTARAVLRQRDLPEIVPLHVRHAVIVAQPLVQKRVVALDQLQHAAVLVNHVIEVA